MADDSAVIAYLKANGMYAHLAAAAGVAAVVKDATVSDVHVASAELEKPKPTDAELKTKEMFDRGEAAVQEGLAKYADIIKSASAADIVFSKGEANLYVSRPLLPGSAERLHAWALEQGIQNVVPPELMHTTQVHSTAEVDTDKFKPDLTVLDVGDGRWLSQLGKGNALVMFFSSPEMQQRFKEAAAAGASWDFPNFMPHITLSYDAGGAAAAEVSGWGMQAPPDMPLQLGPEEFKQSNSNWVDDNGLVEKAADEFTLKLDIKKVQIDQQIIGGWASIATVNGVEVIDKQGDIIAAEELEKAFHEYVLYSRDHGDMHERRGTGKLIACLTFTAEKAAMGLVAKNEKGEALTGTWVEYLITDAGTWASIKKGDLPELSIGGRATPHTV